jgi:2C-methyl-D-erythritol 2,4-cyclodiphosphate synthase
LNFPRLSLYAEDMKIIISYIRINLDDVSIKGNYNRKKMGFGREEGLLQMNATVPLKKNNDNGGIV